MKRLVGCWLSPAVMERIRTTVPHAEKGFMLMARTIGPIDTGIVACFPRFTEMAQDGSVRAEISSGYGISKVIVNQAIPFFRCC